MALPSNPNEHVRMNMEIGGRRTSFSLEAGVWEALRTMCADRQQSMDAVCEDIISDAEPGTSMASAIRTAVLQHFMQRCTA